MNEMRMMHHITGQRHTKIPKIIEQDKTKSIRKFACEYRLFVFFFSLFFLFCLADQWSVQKYSETKNCLGCLIFIVRLKTFSTWICVCSSFHRKSNTISCLSFIKLFWLYCYLISWATEKMLAADKIIKYTERC